MTDLAETMNAITRGAFLPLGSTPAGWHVSMAYAYLLMLLAERLANPRLRRAGDPGPWLILAKMEFEAR